MIDVQRAVDQETRSSGDFSLTGDHYSLSHPSAADRFGLQMAFCDVSR